VCGGIGTTGLSSGVSSSLAHVDPPQSFLRVGRFCRLFLVLPLLILSAKTYADPVVLDCLRLRSTSGESLSIDHVVIDPITKTITGPATGPVYINGWDKQSIYWRFQEWHYLLNLETRLLRSFRPRLINPYWGSIPAGVRRCRKATQK
jgi:hypothetical protein